jgi:Spy/CpxP family protein refolding chaperone
MTRNCLRTILALSLILNFAVIGTVAYYTFLYGHVPGFHNGTNGNTNVHLSDYLDLSDEKRRIWREKSEGYKQELEADWREIQVHREKMIRAIFASQPDPKAIEAERAEIARLQEAIQRALIRHLLDEQGMLDERQRQILVELLLRQDFHPLREEPSRQAPH